MTDTVLPNRSATRRDSRTAKAPGSLDASSIMANAPNPVFVSDLAGATPQDITS